MAQKLYEETNIQNIADAIRTKNGSTDTYKTSEMADAILAISTGGESGGSDETTSVITGTVVILNPDNETWEYYQVATADWQVEVDIGIHDITNVAVVYCDAEKNSYVNRRDMFIGNGYLNGVYNSFNNTGGSAENVAFDDSSAQYCRYDKASGILYLHSTQWTYIKCGTYRYFAW